jgi:hypothetical protein
MLRATAMTAKPIWRERLEALVRGLTGRCGPAVAAGGGIVLPSANSAGCWTSDRGFDAVVVGLVLDCNLATSASMTRKPTV